MLREYLNQITTLKTVVGKDKYNKPTTTEKTINIRWENKRRLIRNSQGKEVVSEAIIFTQEQVKPEDILVWQNRSWEIIGVSDIVDIDGNIQFYEVSV